MEPQTQNKKIWFKRKTYGWGWTPATWEGWSVLLVYVVLFTWNLTSVSVQEPSSLLITFFLKVLILTMILILICYKKGEKPKWTWEESKK